MSRTHNTEAALLYLLAFEAASPAIKKHRPISPDLFTDDDFRDISTILNSLSSPPSNKTHPELFESKAFQNILSVPLNMHCSADSFEDLLNSLEFNRASAVLSSKLHALIGESESISQVYSELRGFLEKNSLKENSKSSGISILPLSKIDSTNVEFLLCDFLPIPKNAVTVLSARGGTGKSWAAIQIALRLAIFQKMKVLLWLCEDPLGESRFRAEWIASNILGQNLDSIDVDITASSPRPLMYFKGQNTYKPTSYYHDLREDLKGYDAVILDPLARFFSGAENDNSDAGQFMGLMSEWADTDKKTFLFLHHAKKNVRDGDSASRGAAAFQDSARICYEVTIPKDGRAGERDFHIIKDNYNAGAYFNQKGPLGQNSTRLKILPDENGLLSKESPSVAAVTAVAPKAKKRKRADVSPVPFDKRPRAVDNIIIEDDVAESEEVANLKTKGILFDD